GGKTVEGNLRLFEVVLTDCRLGEPAQPPQLSGIVQFGVGFHNVNKTLLLKLILEGVIVLAAFLKGNVQ
ncbi:MAG TPA: hypothetical protein PKM01_07500, partial [Anaerolineaceae bacterium]|nr:hypothetical protein [Anaerolineaceae bacterium]